MGRAFLSHSSKDKILVEAVARKLGNKYCVYDTFTFEEGQKNLDEIKKGLEDTDLFVIFLSNDSLKSEWVKEELEIAYNKLQKKEISKIYPIIIDENVDYEDERIPEYLKIYNLQKITKSERIKKIILRLLKEIGWEKSDFLKQKNTFFCGRNDLVEKLETDYHDFQKKINCFVASGFSLIGRKSLMKYTLEKLNLLSKAHTPSIIKFRDNESIEDFIKSIGYKDNGSVRIEFEKTAPFARPISTQLHMCGHVQAENAALAALTVKIALPDVSETVIEQGLAAAVLPARFEVIPACIQNKTITVVIDGFHTPNSARRTLQTFYERFGCGAHLLFACAADKDSESIAHIIKNSPCAFEHVTVTVPGSVKQSDYAKTLTDFNACFDKQKLYGNKDYKNAVEYALHHAAAHNKVLLAAGSFYLAAEVKKILAEITPCAFDEQKPIQ